jgi:hypothetical protein
MGGRPRATRHGLMALAAAAVVAGCGPAAPGRGDTPTVNWRAPRVRAPHPAGGVVVEYPGFLEAETDTERSWLHLTYRAPDAWLSIVFLRECLQPGVGAQPCPGVAGCAVLPGKTALLPLGRRRGRLLETVKTTYFWNTRPLTCARVNVRVATRRPEFRHLTAFAEHFATRVRVVQTAPAPGPERRREDPDE